jgi:hypothetical protein
LFDTAASTQNGSTPVPGDMEGTEEPN